ncbi:hypothetical protein ACJRPK_11115 [Aquimarina sp. 2-A2]|uniref:hypothetical protein n=1 Tax=Aquimarina sp. 2-A2 TaxID=3382644 RepID=UPI00387EF897
MSTTSITIYQNLGKLFYAIAAIDRVIRAKEYAKLKELVKKDWVAVDQLTDEFKTDAAFQIEIVFDWLENEDKDPNECYDDFESYYKENTPHFDASIKKLIWKTANEIANAFSGRNKAEVILLTKLKLLLAS